VPASYIRWPEARAEHRLDTSVAAKIRRKYKVPTQRDGTARIYVDPVAWDEAVAAYYEGKRKQ
jgi:hypothetical protein